MDLSSLMGSSSSGGGMSSAAMGAYIGGQAQQDITNWIAPFATKNALTQGINNAKNEYQTGYNTSTGYYQPYAQTGGQTFQSMSDMVNNGQFQTPVNNYQDSEKQPTYTDPGFNFQTAPGYQFRLQQGLDSVQGQAAAKGSLLSGATLKALDKYGQNFASNEYNNAFNQSMENRQFSANNYNTQLDQYNKNRTFGYNAQNNAWNQQDQNNTNQYNMMNGISQYGYNANQNLSSLANNYYDTRANLAMDQGNVNAGFYQGIANASIKMGQGAKDFGSMMMGKNDTGSGGYTYNGGTLGDMGSANANNFDSRSAVAARSY